MSSYVELMREQLAAEAEAGQADGPDSLRSRYRRSGCPDHETYLRSCNAHLLAADPATGLPRAQPAAWLKYYDVNSLYASSSECGAL
jgi:hypothetical protein